ncbi:MAG: hypothetical protein UY26_C0002G0050 [Candidatus Jorgensenbacteria bacterium GW2011_GWA1_48_13]|uniref:Uncharacterized protein n=1 Tax=Candidatus Jorgensenbacteria bacterium GW2011_GWB1_50_10 TaxID=1618665 RepID=A0A0G1WA14_9BACT|nr:MAG: hypothetical protein UX26_C0014G0017 [Parcubacteria group bacterium GW2011_GWC1_45_9]KKU94268.1 MAG: hypothetical protein UY26_C0002G0050 [Candidatus Jorgensenbacteria bacterium GW2011_GWA1_48_13]KKW15460.1 MAG: hypothetical protein UY55_C0001G0214 [Candidatus Jorgensenbacteria bacterium GW2011_GWB1_50_10]
MVERFIKPEERTGDSLSVQETNEAQLRLMELAGVADTPARAAWIAENSGAFRELLNDPDFRQLVRDGNFDEAKLRLDNFKAEEQKAA